MLSIIHIVWFHALWYVIKAESEQRIVLFLLQSMKCASICFTFIFGMGMFKVFRWNGIEILIPKHMSKSIIGLLEQIQAKNRYGTFFFETPCRICGKTKKLHIQSFILHSSFVMVLFWTFWPPPSFILMWDLLVRRGEQLHRIWKLQSYPPSRPGRPHPLSRTWQVGFWNQVNQVKHPEPCPWTNLTSQAGCCWTE